MPLDYETVMDPAAITGLDSARVVKSLEWDGITYELRNHLEGWIFVTWSEKPTAVVHPYGTDGEHALRLAVARTILGAAKTRIRWNAHNQAGVASNSAGTCWATAWIKAGEPCHSEHDDWDSAHSALADRLDELAAGPVRTGSSLEDEIAQAHLYRAAADVRAAVARARLGDVMREAQIYLQEGRRVAAVAKNLGVERKFLYRVFAGEEWRRR
ncbi:hypothetical protein ACFC26_22040 [Kitasatospora purpeofusca]|uniref:hypothetical protein n=1 Tax=Kitasatospora purpeofusca TaxID=67352 RepID=UPI0035DD7445